MDEIENWMAAVRAELKELRRDNAAMRADNERLRQDIAALRCAVRPADLSPPTVEASGISPEQRPVSRRGMIAAVAGAAGGMLIAGATPAAAANGDAVKAGATTTASTTTQLKTTGGHGLVGVTSAANFAGLYGSSGSGSGVFGRTDGTSATGVQGLAAATTGSNYGVWGSSESTSGTGVYGTNYAGSGTTYGVLGRSNSPTGSGVAGTALAATGTTYGVYGVVNSPDGYALYADGRLKSTGRAYLGAPNSAPVAADLGNGSISFYLDQANDKLKVRVKYTTGTLKTATIALA